MMHVHGVPSACPECDKERLGVVFEVRNNDGDKHYFVQCWGDDCRSLFLLTLGMAPVVTEMVKVVDYGKKT